MRLAGNRQRCQGKTQEETAAIAHEDGCRREIIEKKAEQRAAQGERDHQQTHVARLPEEEAQEASHDQRNPGCQTVHIIEQVDCVGDPYQPHIGDQDIGELRQAVAGDARGKEIGDHPGGDRNRSGDDLADQLGLRRELTQIIPYTHSENNQRASQQPPGQTC